MVKVMCEWSMCKHNTGFKTDDPAGECQKEEVKLCITPGKNNEEALECNGFEWGDES